MTEKFAETAKRAFGFLEGAGFRLTKIEPGQVEYESDNSFVIVSWDFRSGELAAFVGLLPRTGRAQDEYSLADVMGAAGAPETECNPAQVADERRLGPFVSKLAANLRQHAQFALAGDRTYFHHLETFRGAKADRDMREMKLRLVRSEAEAAWQDQQYDRVVSLYSSLEGDLTESETRRLDYARDRRSG